jgi:hypothetical protein
MKKLLNGLLVLSLSILVGCVAGGPPPAVGVWDVKIESPLGTLPGVLTLNPDGTGELASDTVGAMISGIVYADNTAAFIAEISVQGATVVLNFTGSAEGDTLTGVFGSDFGNIPIAGIRQ